MSTRLLAVLAALATLAAATAPTVSARAAEKRCGILVNPTPANWWLNDRDGEWTIGVQGGYQAEGMENMPESLFEKGWVRTNGYYGHRCACLTLDSQRSTMRILRIRGAQALAMRKCTADKALQKALKRQR